MAFSSEDSSAQVNGHVSVMADVLPNESVTEARVRVFLEHRREVRPHVRLNLAGFAEGLVADRNAAGGTTRDAIVRPTDLYAEFAWDQFDLRVGATRLVWGRLDEFQPTDVVNPIDVAKFILEGRSEARMAVWLARARVFLPHSSTLEAVVVPMFRRGRFDQLDEETSPFDLSPPVPRDEPPVTGRNLQGGARFTSTIGRVDWGVSAFRGLEAFPTVDTTVVVRTRSGVPQLVAVANYHRYTMLGADFETVRGQWGVRGEAAVREEHGRTFEGGVGIDRRAGDYRVYSNVLLSHEPGDTDTTLVAAADRSFARETRSVRLFAVYTPTDDTAFIRAIGSVSVRDNVSVEGSGGLFVGTSLKPLGLLTDRDFLYARLKVYF